MGEATGVGEEAAEEAVAVAVLLLLLLNPLLMPLVCTASEIMETLRDWKQKYIISVVRIIKLSKDET